MGSAQTRKPLKRLEPNFILFFRSPLRQRGITLFRYLDYDSRYFAFSFQLYVIPLSPIAYMFFLKFPNISRTFSECFMNFAQGQFVVLHSCLYFLFLHAYFTFFVSQCKSSFVVVRVHKAFRKCCRKCYRSLRNNRNVLGKEKQGYNSPAIVLSFFCCSYRR